MRNNNPAQGVDKYKLRRKIVGLVRTYVFLTLLYDFLSSFLGFLKHCWSDNFCNFRWFLKDKKEFESKNKEIQPKHSFDIYFRPYLTDKSVSAGKASEYLYQDLWAAKKIAKQNPDVMHYDIGSRVDGFITSLLSFRSNIALIDIRPLPYFIDEGLHFIQDDATHLQNIEDDSLSSLSALCSLEHFGLGRYGDPIDPEACFKAFDSIQRVVKPGGKIYISVPIGWQRIEFNGHRIFYPRTIVDCFDKSKLIEFSVATLDPENPIDVNADLDAYNDSDRFYSYFGLFEFERI